MQGEYQRTFLMMRPLDAQDSASTGFCRMERKNNRGKLVFTVQGMKRPGPLYALLVSQDGQEAKVVSCGELRVDARGQGTLTHNLDSVTPSAAAGYRAVCIAEAAQDGVDVMMVGFFGKGRPFDREDAQRLAAKALGIVSSEKKAEAPAPLQQTATPKTIEPPQGPVTKTVPALGALEEADPGLPILKVQEEMPSSRLPTGVWAQPPAEIGTTPAIGLPEGLEHVVWPDAVLPLRELFERFDVASPVTGAENEIFVSIPMSGGMMGIDHYLLGVRLENGTVVAVGYAIPGEPDTPPAGLEGYRWMDTPLGGYWMKWEVVE